MPEQLVATGEEIHSDERLTRLARVAGAIKDFAYLPIAYALIRREQRDMQASVESDPIDANIGPFQVSIVEDEWESLQE